MNNAVEKPRRKTTRTDMGYAIRYRGVTREIPPEVAMRIKILARQNNVTVEKMAETLLSKAETAGECLFLPARC